MPEVSTKKTIVAVAVLVCIGTACSSRASKNAQRRASAETGPSIAATFACRGDRCEQHYPRLPDDGEWTCSDMGGAAVCAGGDPPAGVPFNVPDRAWTCGQRRRAVAGKGDLERVCVDLAPDFPDGVARGWRCHYATSEDITRICERDALAHVIGDACDATRPCLDGLRCVAERCTPDPPSPSCILDDDCDRGVCRFGSCWRDPT